MFVFKRDGRKERVQFDKITGRVARLCYGLDPDHVDGAAITQKVISGVYQGVSTVELDNLAAETAAYLTTAHPDYAILAARIAVSNLHKQTKKQFSAVISDLYHYVNPKNGKAAPMISEDTYKTVMKYAEELNSAIVYQRDFEYNYFGFKTLERSYLLRINNRVVERPQHMIMRVAVGIHGDNIEKAIETYQYMSERYFTHASPTLFNAGTPQAQLASCFLIDMTEDSIEGIYDTLKTCALISKTAGGIGLNVHRIRATGSFITGTNGSSNGLVPMLRVFNNTARYVDQGGNKRPGAFAIYLEPWHADIFSFLDLRKNHGKEEVRARDLFYALWIPDLFMHRVEKNLDWTLFCPNEAPGLADVYGEEFDKLYHSYEREGRGRETFPAQKLWYAIIEAQIETGNPFMLYKDACNRKSNQKNLGTIRSSNLCTEIIEYTSPDEVAVCNLASMALPTFVNMATGTFDFQKLHKVTEIVVENLDKSIDVNYYPVEAAKRSNLRHRPIGVGVQGLADVFMALRLPFDSPGAQHLNLQIFETLYHAALTKSCKLAQISGPYSTYQGSPVSQGIMQYDMWNVTPTDLWDWAGLKTQIAEHGVRNSLLIAPMPTASTSQILGFNECFEPYTSNIYSRRVLAGEFQVVNPWLLRDLVDMGLWSDNMKNRLIAANGSVQDIPNIPDDIKALYRTVWEISQRSIVQMAADRGAFIDQSQSLNIHMREPTIGKITAMHFTGWKSGLKTGMYYLRIQAASAPIQFTVDQDQLKVADTNVARSLSSRKGHSRGPGMMAANKSRSHYGGEYQHLLGEDENAPGSGRRYPSSSGSRAYPLGKSLRATNSRAETDGCIVPSGGVHRTEVGRILDGKSGHLDISESANDLGPGRCTMGVGEAQYSPGVRSYTNRITSSSLRGGRGWENHSGELVGDKKDMKFCNRSCTSNSASSSDSSAHSSCVINLDSIHSISQGAAGVPGQSEDGDDTGSEGKFLNPGGAGLRRGGGDRRERELASSGPGGEPDRRRGDDEEDERDGQHDEHDIYSDKVIEVRQCQKDSESCLMCGG